MLKLKISTPSRWLRMLPFHLSWWIGLSAFHLSWWLGLLSSHLSWWIGLLPSHLSSSQCLNDWLYLSSWIPAWRSPIFWTSFWNVALVQKKRPNFYFTIKARNLWACFTPATFFAPIIMIEPLGNSNMVGTPSLLFSLVGFINKAGKISSQ